MKINHEMIRFMLFLVVAFRTEITPKIEQKDS